MTVGLGELARLSTRGNGFVREKGGWRHDLKLQGCLLACCCSLVEALYVGRQSVSLPCVAILLPCGLGRRRRLSMVAGLLESRR